MKYYQEQKINPLAGCLPLVIQLPIFFALFRVLRSPYKYVPDTSKLYSAFCTTKSGELATVSQCSGDLKRFAYLPTHQKFLGVDLSVTAPNQVDDVRDHRGVLVRGPLGAQRLHAVPPGAATHAADEQADGHGHEDPAGGVRHLLAAVPGRPGALLLREQLLAPRSARGHLPAVRHGREPDAPLAAESGEGGRRSTSRAENASSPTTTRTTNRDGAASSSRQARRGQEPPRSAAPKAGAGKPQARAVRRRRPAKSPPSQREVVGEIGCRQRRQAGRAPAEDRWRLPVDLPAPAPAGRGCRRRRRRSRRRPSRRRPRSRRAPRARRRPGRAPPGVGRARRSPSADGALTNGVGGDDRCDGCRRARRRAGPARRRTRTKSNTRSCRSRSPGCSVGSAATRHGSGPG